MTLLQFSSTIDPEKEGPMSPVSLPQNRFKHLLFDLDGTLIDSGGLMVHFEFIGRTLPLMKKHQGWRVAYQALTRGASSLKRPSKTQTNHERLTENIARHFKVSYSEAEGIMKENLGAVFPKLKSHFGKINGAARFLDWAKEHYSLTLATNPVWHLDFVHMRMKWGGIDPGLFQSVTTVDRMHACKPNKEYYLELLEQENFRADHCLMIGNERKMDLPATAAGVSVFLIRTEAKAMTCIEAPTEKSPGAWRGNYTHLKQLLSLQLGSTP